jgi:DNA-binding GntR family transcriptional regulator
MLNLQPLREQIYQYFRKEMQTGVLLPGSTINLNKLSLELGVSKTPLRDALIQLEANGFVKILPRRGVKVNVLSLNDIKNLYEILGSLEATTIISVFHKFNQSKVDKMERINSKYKKAILAGDFEQIYLINLSFHDSFLGLSENSELRRLIKPLKQRLYDFPRRSYISEWELRNAQEHTQLIEFIKRNDPKGAAHVLQNVHWSFSYQEEFIREFYALALKEYEAEIANLGRS